MASMVRVRRSSIDCWRKKRRCSRWMGLSSPGAWAGGGAIRGSSMASPDGVRRGCSSITWAMEHRVSTWSRCRPHRAQRWRR